ncbi:MAG: M60 family peptidase N-terminal accessory domain-containing protein, partial [Planctomycetota bacterium]
MRQRGITSVLAFAVLAMLLPGLSAAAGPADSRGGGTIYRPGAEFFFYSGKWSADLDIDELTPLYKRVILNTRPAVNLKDDPKVPKGDHFIVCRGYLRVTKPTPVRKVTPGYGSSTYSAMKINGTEVYRRNPGEDEAKYAGLYLGYGYHPFEIVWFGNRNYFTKMYGSPGDVWHTVPFERGMQDELLEAFAALKRHIKGGPALNDDQIDAHKEMIKEHRYAFGHTRAIVEAALDLVATFETEKGALWRDHPEMNKRRKEPRGINWAIYNVMQFIMDEVYTSRNLARYGDLLEGYRYQCSDYFPGKCAPPSDRRAAHTVKIKASHEKAIRDNRMYMLWPARKPTGTYLAPGTTATVRVPRTIVGKNYMVRVGSHSWDNTYKPRVARVGRCTTVFPIVSTETKVANPLGGGIYIEVPYLADAADVVDVTVVGAVRSPYFSAKPFHRTTLDEWRNVERKHKAPWADFQSEKFMMNLPTNWIYKLDDPVTLLRDYDTAMDAAQYLFGLPEMEGKEIMYVQVDRQLRATVHAPGYPSVNSGYDPRKDMGGLSNHYLLRGIRQISATELHERVHAYNIMHMLGDREATVHLAHVAAFNRGLGIDMDTAFRTSVGGYSNLEFRTVDNQAISWMAGIYFSRKEKLVGIKYKHIGHVQWADIARLFGWEALHRYYLSYNDEHEKGIPFPKDRLEIFLRLCESAGADLRPLHHFWGRFDWWDGNNPGSEKAKRLAGMIEKKGLRPSRRIYDQLVRYKSMALRSNKEFQEFTTKWWGKKPSPKGWCHQK